MADDQFQLNWWDTSRNRFENTSTDQTTSQASSINNTASVVSTNYGWSSPSEVVDLKSRSSMDHSLTVQSTGHDHHHHHRSSSTGVDLHMMGLGLSSTNQNLDWSSNQGLLGEKSESSFRQLIQDDHLSSNPSPFEAGASSSGASSSHEQQQHWRLQRASLYSSSCDQDHHSPSVNEFKQINQGFSLDHHQTSSNDNAITSSQNLNANFQQVDSAAAYGLLLSENQPQQQHTSPYDHHQYSNHSTSSNDPLMASWNKYQNFLRTSPPKQQQLHFTNNTPFWNATAVNNDPRPSFFSTQNIIPVAPLYDEKPKVASEVATSKKNSTAETSNKRPRNESSSTLPAFKVRKEKMGDRITALQQLVSPFGKTDTASVLSEAIQYIKFLHEQVSVLSTPYMKNGNPQQHHQQISDKSKDQEGPRQDLRSRGLCLVPVSSTFPMTHETTVDFWTPTFGGTFR